MVTVTMNAGPLRQRHIQNIGQDRFASVRPTAGNDINVAGAWAAGYPSRRFLKRPARANAPTTSSA